MGEINNKQQNIWLASNFCLTDSGTVSNIKTLVLPALKKELDELLMFNPLVNGLLDADIKTLKQAISNCEKRLLLVEV